MPQSASFSPTSNTDVIVIGTDTYGCQNSDTISINVNPLPSVDGGADQTVCTSDTITLSGSGATSYSWDLVGKNSLQFDGVNDNVNLGNSTSLDLRNDFTIEANIKLDGTNSNNIIFAKSDETYNSSTPKGYMLSLIHISEPTRPS